MIYGGTGAFAQAAALEAQKDAQERELHLRAINGIVQNLMRNKEQSAFLQRSDEDRSFQRSRIAQDDALKRDYFDLRKEENRAAGDYQNRFLDLKKQEVDALGVQRRTAEADRVERYDSALFDKLSKDIQLGRINSLSELSSAEGGRLPDDHFNNLVDMIATAHGEVKSQADAMTQASRSIPLSVPRTVLSDFAAERYFSATGEKPSATINAFDPELARSMIVGDPNISAGRKAAYLTPIIGSFLAASDRASLQRTPKDVESELATLDTAVQSAKTGAFKRWLAAPENKKGMAGFTADLPSREIRPAMELDALPYLRTETNGLMRPTVAAAAEPATTAALTTPLRPTSTNTIFQSEQEARSSGASSGDEVLMLINGKTFKVRLR